MPEYTPQELRENHRFHAGECTTLEEDLIKARISLDKLKGKHAYHLKQCIQFADQLRDISV